MKATAKKRVYKIKKNEVPYYGWTNIKTMEAYEWIMEQSYDMYRGLRIEIFNKIKTGTNQYDLALFIKEFYHATGVDYDQLAEKFMEIK